MRETEKEKTHLSRVSSSSSLHHLHKKLNQPENLCSEMRAGAHKATTRRDVHQIMIIVHIMDGMAAKQPGDTRSVWCPIILARCYGKESLKRILDLLGPNCIFKTT